jgi:hypothetical protein
MDPDTSEKINKTKTLHYECKTCFETDKDKFYGYLPTKCIPCKRKLVKDKKQENSAEKRLEKLNEIDPENKVRDIIEEVMKKDKVIENKSIFKFLNDVNSEINSNAELMDVKFNKVSSYLNELYKLINKLNDENIKLRNEFYDIVSELKEENVNLRNEFNQYKNNI